METYALLADRSASRPVFAFYTSDPEDPPVRLTFPNIHDVQARSAANNGCLAAYQTLMHRELLSGQERFILSCQFADEAADLKVQGGSAGLALCLHFAREVCPDRFQETAIAATGTVSDGTQEARVGKVEGIVPKLQAALEALPSGGRILFPAGNEPEIPIDIHRQAETKGIELQPVDTVRQALETLLIESAEPAPPPRKKLWVKYALAGGLLVAALGAWYLSSPDLDIDTAVAQVAEHLEQGEFITAREQLVALQQNTRSKHSAVVALSGQIDSVLHLEAHFHYAIPGRKGKVPVRPEPGTSSPRPVLRSGDRYRIECTVSDTCYLYVYQVDSAGKVDQLPDPSPYVDPLFLQAGRTYFFPGGDKDWFTLDDQEGPEMLYFVAARTPSRDLQDIYRQYREATGPEKGMYRERLVVHLKKRQQARTAGVRGVFLSTFTFLHESRREPSRSPVSPH